MNISSVKSYKSLFESSKGEDIDFLANSNGYVFISKTLIRKNDFNGKLIVEPDNRIRTKSIWMVDTKDDVNTEIIHHGDFDINEVYFTENDLYYLKITDTDNDGLLLESDYNNGYVWRLHRDTLEQAFCFKVEPYKFHRFLTANMAIRAKIMMIEIFS